MIHSYRLSVLFICLVFVSFLFVPTTLGDEEHENKFWHGETIDLEEDLTVFENPDNLILYKEDSVVNSTMEENIETEHYSAGEFFIYERSSGEELESFTVEQQELTIEPPFVTVSESAESISYEIESNRLERFDVTVFSDDTVIDEVTVDLSVDDDFDETYNSTTIDIETGGLDSGYNSLTWEVDSTGDSVDTEVNIIDTTDFDTVFTSNVYESGLYDSTRIGVSSSDELQEYRFSVYERSFGERGSLVTDVSFSIDDISKDATLGLNKLDNTIEEYENITVDDSVEGEFSFSEDESYELVITTDDDNPEDIHTAILNVNEPTIDSTQFRQIAKDDISAFNYPKDIQSGSKSSENVGIIDELIHIEFEVFGISSAFGENNKVDGQTFKENIENKYNGDFVIKEDSGTEISSYDDVNVYYSQDDNVISVVADPSDLPNIDTEQTESFSDKTEFGDYVVELKTDFESFEDSSTEEFAIESLHIEPDLRQADGDYVVDYREDNLSFETNLAENRVIGIESEFEHLYTSSENVDNGGFTFPIVSYDITDDFEATVQSETREVSYDFVVGSDQVIHSVSYPNKAIFGEELNYDIQLRDDLSEDDVDISWIFDGNEIESDSMKVEYMISEEKYDDTSSLDVEIIIQSESNRYTDMKSFEVPIESPNISTDINLLSSDRMVGGSNVFVHSSVQFDNVMKPSAFVHHVEYNDERIDNMSQVELTAGVNKFETIVEYNGAVIKSEEKSIYSPTNVFSKSETIQIELRDVPMFGESCSCS